MDAKFMPSDLLYEIKDFKRQHPDVTPYKMLASTSMADDQASGYFLEGRVWYDVTDKQTNIHKGGLSLSGITKTNLLFGFIW